jgi:hypothetical protein
MIDPLEALIANLHRDADINALVDGQIAERHKYGEGWARPSAALQVQLDGGEAELYVPWQRPRIEARCYGPTRPEAMAVYQALVAFSRRTHRDVVETSQGYALVYWFLLDSGPSLLRDPDVGMDFVLVYAKLAVAETDVDGRRARA